MLKQVLLVFSGLLVMALAGEPYYSQSQGHHQHESKVVHHPIQHHQHEPEVVHHPIQHHQHEPEVVHHPIQHHQHEPEVVHHHHHQQEEAEVVHHPVSHHPEPEVEVHVPQPYEFGYKIHDGKGNTQFREENGNGHGGVTGSYGYKDKLGVYRKVSYVADKFGFRANVHTNEPGTGNQNPADVNIKAETPPFYVYYKPVEHNSYKEVPVHHHEPQEHGHESYE